MKITSILFSIFLAAILFQSCQNENKAQTGTDQQSARGVAGLQNSIQLNNFDKYADAPCDLLTQEFIQNYFSPGDEEMEQVNEVNPDYKNRNYCGYTWRRENFQEINERNAALRTEAMKDPGTMMKTLLSMESTVHKIGIGSFIIYENEMIAAEWFQNSHTAPSQQELQSFEERIGTEAQQQDLSEDDTQMAGDLGSGIGSAIKFEDVQGVGTMASWDFLDKKLSVLVGSYSFGIFIEHDDDYKRDIEKAKEIALNVIELMK